MPGTMITESFRKRRLSDTDEDPNAKRSKLMTKENRSPNLTMLQQLQEDLDPFVEGQQIADQVASLEEGPKDYEESSSKEEQGGSDSNESSFDREGSQAQTASSTACATQAPKRPTAAGLRPRITAQVASLMSVSIDLDSDSSNDEEEEEPLPVKKHKGMGRYGQDLHNTACLALKQTNLLKKKSANRTTKTVRQLCNAKEHSCEAAQKAVEATKAAEKAVQNLAQFAEAFDDLVKEAVRAANAAAQSRADYAVSVVAADMAEARRDRVMSKRGRRRSTSPKTPKRMSWAADEQLVQERVFSKADPPSATSFATSMAAAPATH
ncbi:hypothetical protein WJX79_007139 [Trebouxia sp. C0005]